jgi:ribosome-associated protein
MLRITPDIAIGDDEIEITPHRAAGPGGQHGDKAATAVHLRFDIAQSSLPEAWREQLLARRDQRITTAGVVVIKAQAYRHRARNERSARERLRQLLQSASRSPPTRRATRPSLRAKTRRREVKRRRGRTKALRKPPPV